MIGSLRGKIILKDSLNLVIEAGGVGYRVLVSDKIYTKAAIGDSIFVYTYTHVREDELALFGFAETEDLKLFQNLISVSGVGPKTAMSLFSFAARREIVEAVMKGDVDFFTSVPRLGRKNAQKIIIELKNKFGDKGGLDLSGDGDSNETVSALKSFGFSNQEIMEALRNSTEAKTPEEKIKMALKYLGK
jgi:Holliday junction DNA helicase RuvA